ncbi:MAG: TaqI-like C-terminal specificity domain-containing protein, partial [Fidelibacterota bacterium]
DVNIYYGIKTGLNEAFIIDTPVKERLCAEDPKSAEILKPILRGRDIKRYRYDWKGLWVIATFPPLHVDIDQYPAVKKHLLNFGKERLEQAGKTLADGTKSRKKTGNKWFETQDQIGYYPEFEKEKVVYREISKNMDATIVNKGLFLTNKLYLVTGSNLRLLLGIFNSFLFKHVFLVSANLTGGKGIDYLGKIKIPPITPANQPIASQIETLVDSILAAKKDNPQANTQEQERQIDQLVYQLYGLTEEEIRIVEGKK